MVTPNELDMAMAMLIPIAIPIAPPVMFIQFSFDLRKIAHIPNRLEIEPISRTAPLAPQRGTFIPVEVSCWEGSSRNLQPLRSW